MTNLRRLFLVGALALLMLAGGVWVTGNLPRHSGAEPSNLNIGSATPWPTVAETPIPRQPGLGIHDITLGPKEGLNKQGQFSNNGRLLATISAQEATPYSSTLTFHDWNAKTAAPLAHWKLSTLQQFALSPNGRSVAVIRGERERRGIGTPFAVELRDVYSGQIQRTLIRAGTVKAAIYSLAWSGDGRLLATGSGDGVARVWDVSSGRRIASLPAGGFVGALQFSSDAKILATVGDTYSENKSRIRLWNWRQKEQSGEMPFDAYSTSATLTFSPGGKYLAASNTFTGKTTLYTVQPLQIAQHIPAPSQVPGDFSLPTPSVAFSGDEKVIAFVDGSNLIVQDLVSKHPLWRRKLKESTGSYVLTLQFTPQGALRWVTVRYQYVEHMYGGSMDLVAPRIWEFRLPRTLTRMSQRRHQS